MQNKKKDDKLKKTKIRERSRLCEEKNERKKLAAGMKFLFALLFTASIGLIASGVYLMFFKNRDAYERQAEERDLADTYIDDLILKLTDPEAYGKKGSGRSKGKGRTHGKT